MQQKHLPRRLLSLLLTLAMLFTLLVPAVSAAPDGRSGDARELEVSPLDPSTLHVQKLGETELTAPAADQDPYALTDLVRVSIVLEGAATLDRYPLRNVARNSAALAYRQSLRDAQDAMQAKIEAATGKTLAVKWNLTLAANMISANVRYGDIETIRQVPGVARVVIENRYEAPTDETQGDTASPNTANTSENMVGAWEAWDLGYTGAGSRVAIIDTGIDTAHQSFAAEPFTYSVGLAGATGELMTQAQVQALASQLNSKNGNYVNAKIPYGYNYVDGNTTIDHMSDTEGNHGSHVAGIAAANRYIGSAHDDAAATVGAVGMAPDAQLFVMKVFGANGGAYDSDYMVAIEDAIVLDCDVVNLSLGSGSQGWTYDGTYQDILNNLTNKAHNEGMVVSISAGNSYDFAYATGSRNLYKDDVYYHTGGSPGTFVNSLCVAAAQNTLSKGTPMNFNGVGDVFYYESTGNEEEGTTYSNPALSTIKGSYSYVYIDGVGSAAEYAAVNSAVSLSGKIVIVNRGELSFVEKGENAKSYNPKAVIIANNQDGTIYMDLTDFTGSFPMVTITLKDANKIKAASATQTAGGYTVYTGSVEVTDVEKEVTIDRSQATITDFSSWGIPGSLLMKPEITAPGGDIYSVNGTNKTSSGSSGGTDQYVSYSGTSMAAPHITGLAAVIAEYLREHPISARNSELYANYSTRAINQSLLMSTATPMAPENEYLSILQQGAGLAEVAKAVQSPSVIMMTDEGNTLTVRTGANADGKIKAELGDAPAKTGTYSFGFKVYNLTDNVLTYELDTDLFSQKISGEFLVHGTSLLPAGGVSYTWNGEGPSVTESHDVDKDGDTDNDDAQAILDFLSGEKAAADLDLTAADLDEDGEVTSRDAYLLIDWTPAEEPVTGGYTVPAHGAAEVKVTINLTAEQRAALAAYAKGAYLEGFTYLTCSDGSEHSIPILGFYGSWTDPSMFDNMSYVDELYGAQRIPYSGTSDTNYLLMNYAGANVKFSGNPYMVEDEFPAQRLAVNGSTNLIRISYNLIRSAGTTGYAVTKLDADHKVTDVVSSTVTGNGVLGQWYYVNQGSWQNTMTKLYGINKTVASYGLTDGELFRVGYYAIPEYNGMVVNESYDQGDCGMLDQTGFNKLLLSNTLGSGAFVGYDFTVDNAAPQVTNAALNGSTLSVSASDNLNLAYVAVLSLDGSVKYAEAAPGAKDYTISFDASEAIANANGYVAVFAGDYAGNEAAVAVKVNDNTHVEKTVYVLTDSLTAGNDYVIAEVNAAGTAHVLGYTAGTYSNTVAATAVTVQAGNSDTGSKPYMETADVPATAVWTASSGVKLMNGSNYLRHTSSTSNTLSITTANTYNSWTYNSNNTLQVNSRYLRYYNNTYSLSTATTNKIYLYVKTTISYEVDPYAVSGVSVTPETLDLYKGGAADLTAKVTPLTASDRTVSWSSSNTAVATVDQNGHVTAVAKGSTVITASSNANPAVQGSCTVTVEAVNKELSAIIWDEEGSVFFSYFNANNLPTWTKRSNNGVTVNGNPLYLHNAVMIDASNLYASTLDIADTSILYSVNRSTYAVTEYGTNYVPAFGMARVGTSFGTGYFVYGFAKYLIFGNLAPETDDELGTFSGFPYGLLDLSTTNVGDAYVVGICARTISTTSATYYFLDETGKIWQTNQTYSSSDGISFGTPTLVVDTGLGAGLQYQSLYYDGTWIYWSRQADNVSELIMYNPSTGKLYNAGNFGEGVWPAAGLYVNGSAAPASVEEPAETLELQPLRIGRDELMSAEIMARFEAEAAKKNEPANAVNGGVNAILPSVVVKTTDESTGSAGNGVATVTLTETEDVNNGLVTVSYDPAVLTYTGSSSDFAYISVHPESGVITLAYADKTAHTDLAVLSFSYTGMLNTNVTVHTAQRNSALAVEEDDAVINLKDGSKTVTVYVVDELDGSELYAWAWGNSGNLDNAWPGHALTAEGTDKGGHNYYSIALDLVDYDKIIFNRNGQPQTATLDVAADAGENDYVVYYVYGVSGNDLQVSQGDDLWPAPGVVTEPSCTEGGYTTYTGVFTGETRTGNEVPALGHTPGEPVEENRVEPTATTEGGYDSVIYCTRCNAELSREHVTIPATGPAEPVLDESIVLYNSIGIGVEIQTTFGVRKTVTDRFESWYIEVNKLDASGNITETKRFGAGQEGAVSDGYIREAVYTDITAKEMGVSYAASFHGFAADGSETYSNTVTNTVRDYVIGELVKTDNDDATRKLAADLLNYGAAAQTYFNFDAENLVNANLSAEAQAAMTQFADVGEAPAALVNGSNGPNVYGSVSIMNRVVLSLTVRGVGSPSELKVLVKNHETGETKATVDAVQRGSVWMADYAGFEAEDMRTLFDFVPVADGVETGTPLTWSVEGYAREARLNEDASEAELALFNALLFYVDAAKAAYGN